MSEKGCWNCHWENLDQDLDPCCDCHLFDKWEKRNP